MWSRVCRKSSVPGVRQGGRGLAIQGLLDFGRTWAFGGAQAKLGTIAVYWTADGHDLIYHLKGLSWLLKVSFFLLVFYEDQC